MCFFRVSSIVRHYNSLFMFPTEISHAETFLWENMIVCTPELAEESYIISNRNQLVFISHMPHVFASYRKWSNILEKFLSKFLQLEKVASDDMLRKGWYAWVILTWWKHLPKRNNTTKMYQFAIQFYHHVLYTIWTSKLWGDNEHFVTKHFFLYVLNLPFWTGCYTWVKKWANI